MSKHKPRHKPVPMPPAIVERPLQPDRLIRRVDLHLYVGLRKSQIDYLIAAKEFPKPIKLSDSGRSIAWLASEILSWQLSRIAKREADAS
jgi:predicted DNA-binding transcriptional regulator AlpA